MTHINYITKSEVVTEARLHTFIAFASDLRFPVGKFPTTLNTALGNRQPFSLQRVDANGTAHYKQQFGCVTLAVYND